MKRLILMLMFACSSFAAHSQQPPNGGSPCPPGMIPGYGKCYAPNDPDRFYQGPEVEKPGYSGPLWQDRFGAIALDSETGSIGWASGAKSKKDAAKAAIADCGGGGCKIKAQTRNSCLATAWGDGVSGFAGDPDIRKAEAMALSNCGNAGCKIQYSACSLPVRVR
ncbi:DUF4189 domain-containing protein [Solilutibacter silvestris]|uniref:DUF4189 domain-containing protein n=1 Tax=Solilutibacter silvestris TaxID=1645665 RepID=UPI003D356F8C